MENEEDLLILEEQINIATLKYLHALKKKYYPIFVKETENKKINNFSSMYKYYFDLNFYTSFMGSLDSELLINSDLEKYKKMYREQMIRQMQTWHLFRWQIIIQLAKIK